MAEPYGVIRTLTEAWKAAADARSEGLQGYYPAAAVVLARELDAALDTLEWVHNADQATDRRGVLVNMPEAMRRVREVLANSGRLDGNAGVAVLGGHVIPQQEPMDKP